MKNRKMEKFAEGCYGSTFGEYFPPNPTMIQI